MIKNQHGFGHVAIFLLILVVVAVIGFAGWRIAAQSDGNDNGANQPGTQNKTTSQVSDEPDIELQNIGVSIKDIDFNTHATSEFASHGLKGFYVFGDKLPGNRLNPNFEFASLSEGTEAVSAIDGIVAFVKFQPDSNDSEVFIQPKEGSQWTVGYDHLSDLSVKKGDTVKAGDRLGTPARQNNGLLRFEIQVNKDANGQTTHVCPATLLAPSAKPAILSDLSVMQTTWMSTTKLALYDLTKQDPVGCLQKTLTPAQAEGRG